MRTYLKRNHAFLLSSHRCAWSPFPLLQVTHRSFCRRRSSRRISRQGKPPAAGHIHLTTRLPPAASSADDELKTRGVTSAHALRSRDRNILSDRFDGEDWLESMPCPSCCCLPP